MSAAVVWGSRFTARSGLIFTMPVHDDELRKSMLEDGDTHVRFVELPRLLGAFLWAGVSAVLEKAQSHKYIRRVPDGKGGWRYFYAVSGGKGLGHEDEIQTGAAFKLAHNGQAGHFHVTGRDADGKITIRHDESGHTETLDPAVFVAMLHREHAAALDEHTKKVAGRLAAVRQHGTEKQQARVEDEARRYGHTRHLLGGSKPATREAPTAEHADADFDSMASIKASRSLTEIRSRRPRPIDKLFGKNGPTPEQKAKYDADVKAWNAEYRKAQKAHKTALEAENGERAGSAKKPDPAAEALATARAHLDEARAKDAAGDKEGAAAHVKASEASAAEVRAHRAGIDPAAAHEAATAATAAAGGVSAPAANDAKAKELDGRQAKIDEARDKPSGTTADEEDAIRAKQQSHDAVRRVYHADKAKAHEEAAKAHHEAVHGRDVPGSKEADTAHLRAAEAHERAAKMHASAADGGTSASAEAETARAAKATETANGTAGPTRAAVTDAMVSAGDRLQELLAITPPKGAARTRHEQKIADAKEELAIAQKRYARVAPAAEAAADPKNDLIGGGKRGVASKPGKPALGASVGASDVKVGERVVDSKGKTWERTGSAWRGVKPDGSPTGDTSTDKAIGRETLRRALHNDGDRAVAIDAVNRAAGEAHAKGDTATRDRLQDEAAGMMPSTASGRPIPPADASPEAKQAITDHFGARDHADAAAHHATEAKAAEAAGNEHAADMHTAAVAEHHQGVVEAVQAGETHGPNTLTTSSGKALPPHDAPSAAWDKATAGFTAAEHDEAAGLHRAKVHELRDTTDDGKASLEHLAAAGRHAAAAEKMTAIPEEPGSRAGRQGSRPMSKLEPWEKDTVRDFANHTAKHRLDDLKRGLKEEQRMPGGMSIYSTKGGKTFAAPTDANAHEIAQAWMTEMGHEAMHRVDDEVAETHGLDEEQREISPESRAGMLRVLTRAMRPEATQAIVGSIKRINNDPLAALPAAPPSKGSGAWEAALAAHGERKAAAEKATAEVNDGRLARGKAFDAYQKTLGSKAEQTYALMHGRELMHGSSDPGRRQRPAEAKAEAEARALPEEAKRRIRGETAKALGLMGGTFDLEASNRAVKEQHAADQKARAEGHAANEALLADIKAKQDASLGSYGPGGANAPDDRFGKEVHALKRHLDVIPVGTTLHAQNPNGAGSVESFTRTGDDEWTHAKTGSKLAHKDFATRANRSGATLYMDQEPGPKSSEAARAESKAAFDMHSKARQDHALAGKASQDAGRIRDHKAHMDASWAHDRATLAHDAVVRHGPGGGRQEAADAASTAARDASAGGSELPAETPAPTPATVPDELAARRANAPGADAPTWVRAEHFKGKAAGIEAARASMMSASLGRDLHEPLETYLARSPQAKARYEAARQYLVANGALADGADKAAPAEAPAPAQQAPHYERTRSGAYADEHRDISEAHTRLERSARNRGDQATANLHRDAAEAHAHAALAHDNVAQGRSSPGQATEHATVRAEKATERAGGDPTALSTRLALEQHTAEMKEKGDGEIAAYARGAYKGGSKAEQAAVQELYQDEHARRQSGQSAAAPTPGPNRIGQASISKDVHPKTGADSHVVKLDYRLGDDHFHDSAVRAKELGGSYVRRVGFAFPDRQAAETFAHEHAAPKAGPNRTAQAKEAQAAAEASNKAAGVAPRVTWGLGEREAVNPAELHEHRTTSEAINRYAEAVDAGAPAGKIATLRQAATLAATRYTNAGSRQGYQGKATMAAHRDALAKRLGEIDAHVGRKNANDAPHSQTKFDAHVEAMRNEGSKYGGGNDGDAPMRADFKGAVDHALQGGKWEVPGYQKTEAGNVPLRAAVEAVHSIAESKSGQHSPEMRRAAHALGLPITLNEQHLTDMPHETLQRMAASKTSYGANYEADNAHRELDARAKVGAALGVPVEKVGPQIGTSVEGLTDGIGAVRKRAQGDHGPTKDRAHAELKWRQGVADKMGHKTDLSTLADGGKADPVWSAEQITDNSGNRHVRQGNRWHAVAPGDGKVSSSGLTRAELERSGTTFSASKRSAEDLHNDTANEVAAGRGDAKGRLISALRAHAGAADAQHIESKAGGNLPLEHVVRSMGLVGNTGYNREPDQTPWHEHMTDGQLGQVAKMNGVADHVRQNAGRELEARNAAGLGEKAQAAATAGTVQLSPKEGEPKAGPEIKADIAHGLAVHKAGKDGWAITHPTSGRTWHTGIGTKGEAMQAVGVMRDAYGQDIPQATPAPADYERLKAAHAKAGEHLLMGTAARSVAVGKERSGKLVGGSEGFHAGELRRMSAETVGPAEAPKIVPKPLTPEQARRRLGTFASKEETRPTIHGYHVDGEKHLGVATDGHRLVTAPVTGHDVQETGGTAIYRHQDPKGHDAFMDLKAQQMADAKQTPEQVAKWKAEWHAHEGAGSKVTSFETDRNSPDFGKTVPARFPDYTNIRPDDAKMQHDHVDAKRVRDVLAHANPLASQRTNSVTIHREGGKLYLGVGGNGSENMPEHVKVPIGTTAHPDGKIALNGRYLDDALKGAKGSVTIGQSSHLSPMTVHRADGEKHVIMPMRL